MFVSYIVLNTNEVNKSFLNLLVYNVMSSSIDLTNTLIIIIIIVHSSETSCDRRTKHPAAVLKQ